jgi:hypothetical protein
MLPEVPMDGTTLLIVAEMLGNGTGGGVEEIAGPVAAGNVAIGALGLGVVGAGPVGVGPSGAGLCSVGFPASPTTGGAP